MTRYFASTNVDDREGFPVYYSLTSCKWSASVYSIASKLEAHRADSIDGQKKDGGPENPPL